MLSLLALVTVLAAKPQASQLPDTLPAKRLAEFIEAFNTKDPDKIGVMVGSSFAKSALKILSKEEWTKRISGATSLAPIAVTSVLKSSDTTIVVRLSGNTDKMIAMRLDLENESPFGIINAILGSPEEALGTKNPKKYAGWETIQALVEQVRKDFKLPALSAAYSESGKPIMFWADGVKSTKQPDEIALGDRFAVGAIGKSMTATLIAKMVEMKKLTWTTTLGEALPGTTMAEAYKAITIDQLLQHKSGMPMDFPYDSDALLKLTEKASDGMSVRKAVVNDFLSKEPTGKVGDQAHDSNVDYVIAGHVVERLIGKSFEWMMQRYVFDPMKLKSPLIAPIGSEGQVGSEGAVADHLQGDFGYTPYQIPNLAHDMLLAPAGAGVSSNMPDLVAFAQFHLTGMKDSNVLTAESYKHIHTAPAGAHPDQDVYGWLVNPTFAGGEPCLVRTGTDGSFYADLTIWPDAKLVIVAATNAGTQRQPSPTLQTILAVHDKIEKKE